MGARRDNGNGVDGDPLRRFRAVAWAFLGYTVLVIVYGAFVRATLSGDGCGDHWPSCNGELIPFAPERKTVVEFAHRVTSGLAWFFALGVFLYARRVAPKRHRVRRYAALGLFLMTTEALIGAGLVVLKMVADNPSLARGWWTGGHLLNTFLLLVALTLLVFFAEPRGARRREREPLSIALLVVLAGVLLLGMSGAIVALGDTIFRVETLAEGLAQDRDPNAHLFVRLRVYHPLIALAVGALTMFTVGQIFGAAPRRSEHRRVALAALCFFVLQIAVGFLNVWLLAPVWMQLLHLLVADALWIALVWLAALVFTETLDAPDLSGEVGSAAAATA